jgi:hypothetical protein
VHLQAWYINMSNHAMSIKSRARVKNKSFKYICRLFGACYNCIPAICFLRLRLNPEIEVQSFRSLFNEFQRLTL